MNHLRKFDPWCNMQTAKKVFSFPEMIAWRKAKVIQERLQRNKKLMHGIQRTISPAFQLAHLECHSTAKPDLTREWKDLGLRRELLEALSPEKGLNLKRPLPTQIQGIEPVMKNRRVLFAAQTGSGKTLTYLLPLFQKLKGEEDQLLKKTSASLNSEDVAKKRTEALASLRSPASPRAVILLPTRELVRQVYKIAKGLSHHCKLKVEICDDLEGKDDFVDILIATPKSLSTLLERRVLKSGKISHFVIDEADTLLTGDFLAETKAILNVRPEASIVATSATITKSLQRSIKSTYPDMQIVAAQGLHEAAQLVRQRFIKITQPGNEKMRRCLEILRESPTSRLLIFCNKLSKAEQVHQFLTESMQSTESATLPSLFHGSLPSTQRTALLDQFARGNVKVLVCTDLAARGLDTTWVNHVINYDFPRSIQDYLHRIGRTARAGRGGVVSSFVTGKDEGLWEYIQLAVKQNRSFSQPLLKK